MDEVELVSAWGGDSSQPGEDSIARARTALDGTIAAPQGRRRVYLSRAREGVRGGFTRIATLAGIATAAIMIQPHTPLGLPGHRALGWLALLLMMRLAGGAGWATGVGFLAAVGTMAIGRSPNGSFWGVLQYVVAGIGVDVFLSVRPQLARSPLTLAGLGALLLMLVGWITPISNSFVGGVPLRGIWLSLASVPAASWVRLLSFDLAFGAGAGLIGYCLGWALNPQRRHLAGRRGVQATT